MEVACQYDSGVLLSIPGLRQLPTAAVEADCTLTAAVSVRIPVDDAAVAATNASDAAKGLCVIYRLAGYD
jgi:hypothetical protein